MLVKSVPPVARPTTGITMSVTSESTMRWKAAPMMMPTARSMTLPLAMNSRNSFSMRPPTCDSTAVTIGEMPISLTPRQRAGLKARAHALEPRVQVGQAGLSDAVVKEIDRALTAHELIKVKILADRDAREEIAETIARANRCSDSFSRSAKSSCCGGPSQTTRPNSGCLSRQRRRFDAFAERERRAHRGHHRGGARQPAT